MKKLFAWCLLVGLIMVCVSCSSKKTSKNEPEVISNITDADLIEMKSSLQSVLMGNPIVSVIDSKGQMAITVSYDPIILRYEFGAAVDTTINTVKERLDGSDIELGNINIMGFFYEHGEKSQQISFSTSDYEQGLFSDTESGVFGKATVEYVLAFCNYNKT